jgi:hypothetical protein
VLLDHIAAAGIEGDTLEWCDVLVFGPTPKTTTAEEWYDLRANALEELGGPAEGIPYRARLVSQDRLLDAAIRDPDAELVLWFGPELSCQAILLALLSRLHGRPNVSLISPGDIPGKPRGCTVSFLSESELHAAFAVRAVVSAAQTGLARRIWDAWRQGALRERLADDLSPLPHVRDALTRYLAEPERTEDLIREARRAGLRDWRDIYRAVQAAEPRPWLTDTLFLHRFKQITDS